VNDSASFYLDLSMKLSRRVICSLKHKRQSCICNLNPNERLFLLYLIKCYDFECKYFLTEDVIKFLDSPMSKSIRRLEIKLENVLLFL